MVTEGFNQQETGLVPANPYASTSPWDQFLMSGIDFTDPSWLEKYDQQGEGAFEGTGIDGYDATLDEELYGNGADGFGADSGLPDYNPDDDLAGWETANTGTVEPSNPAETTPETTSPAPEAPPTESPSPTGVQDPPMPPWMENLISGQSFQPWSLNYSNPTPYASRQQWQNMNPSERRGYMGTLKEYEREDFLANMEKAFVPGTQRSKSYIM